MKSLSTKMKNFFLLIFCVSIRQFEIVEGNGVLAVTFLNYSSYDHRLASGSCCTEGISHCRYDCNVDFSICLSTIEQTSNCSISGGNIVSGTYAYSKKIDFQNKWRGSSIHPLSMEVPKPLESIYFHTLVSDHGRKVADFEKILHLKIGERMISQFQWKRSRRSIEKELYVEFDLQCADYYEPPDCKRKCVPRDDNNGHYTCHKNNGKICLPGWQNKQTNCTERNSSYSLSLSPSYRLSATSLYPSYRLSATSLYPSYRLSTTVADNVLLHHINSLQLRTMSSMTPNSQVDNAMLSSSLHQRNHFSEVSLKSIPDSIDSSISSTSYVSPTINALVVVPYSSVIPTITFANDISDVLTTMTGGHTLNNVISPATSSLRIDTTYNPFTKYHTLINNYTVTSHSKISVLTILISPSNSELASNNGNNGLSTLVELNKSLVSKTDISIKTNFGDTITASGSTDTTSNRIITTSDNNIATLDDTIKTLGNRKQSTQLQTQKNFIYYIVVTVGFLFICAVVFVLFLRKYKHHKRKNKVNPSSHYVIGGEESKNSTVNVNNCPDNSIIHSYSDNSIHLTRRIFTMSDEIYTPKNQLESATGTFFMNPPPNVPIESEI